MLSRNKKAIQAFHFLQERAKSQKSFDVSDLIAATGWKEQTVKTYISKKWKDYLASANGGKRLRVKREFARVRQARFLSEFTQKEQVFTHYARTKHAHVVQFEFLFPLTKEDQLRQALVGCPPFCRQIKLYEAVNRDI